LDDYADNSQLRPIFQLGTNVPGINRSEKGDEWITNINRPDSNVTEEEFDKVIITNVTFYSPVMLDVLGIDKFGGKVIHSQSFKECVHLSKHLMESLLMVEQTKRPQKKEYDCCGLEQFRGRHCR
jgi:cation diffusion facilitator CzcD-associated flavoprotein CzcO